MPYSSEVKKLIADFYGFQEEKSSMRDRGAKSVASILEACVEKYQIGKETPQEKILANWPSIIGKSYANRCAPEKVDHSGILVIRVGNSILRRELHFMEDRIMTAIRSLDGCDHIRGITFKAG